MKRMYYFLFWALFSCFFIVLFLRPITSVNEDLGRHILLGSIIIQTHHVPPINLLSYTYTNFPFINTSWLSEVIFSLITRVWGMNLLLLISICIIACSLGIEIFFSLKTFSPRATMITALVYLLLLAFRSDVRPEIYSMFFLSIFMVTLYSFHTNTVRKVLLLTLCEIAWVNLHIYFFVGPLLILLFFVSDCLQRRFRLKKISYFYLLALFGTLAATSINPHGLQGALFPLFVLQNYGFPVAENQTIFTLYTLYHKSFVLFPIGVIAALSGLLFLGRKHAKPIDWLLTIVFGIAALIIFRNLLLFVFTTFFTFASQLDFAFQDWLRKVKISGLLYPLFLFVLLLCILASLSTHPIGLGVMDYGKGAADFLVSHKILGPLFNDFNIGGYLSYRIYPQKVYIDNRPEAYPASFFQHIYIPMQENPTLFAKADNKYHFNAVVIEHWDGTASKNELQRFLLEDPQYALVYLDPYTFILLRKNKTNASLISQTAIKQSAIDITRINDPHILTQYLFFFEKVGWKDLQKHALLKLQTLKS